MAADPRLSDALRVDLAHALALRYPTPREAADLLRRAGIGPEIFASLGEVGGQVSWREVIRQLDLGRVHGGLARLVETASADWPGCVELERADAALRGVPPAPSTPPPRAKDPADALILEQILSLPSAELLQMRATAVRLAGDALPTGVDVVLPDGRRQALRGIRIDSRADDLLLRVAVTLRLPQASLSLERLRDGARAPVPPGDRLLDHLKDHDVLRVLSLPRHADGEFQLNPAPKK